MLHWMPSVSQHLAISAIALFIYVLTTRLRHTRRAPSAAIAWVIGLALLPYVFLPLHLLFGQRKIGPPRIQPPFRAEAPLSWVDSLMESFCLTAPAATQVRFHADGEQARAALFSVLESARERLDVSSFLIADDSLGREVLARLVERARAGVAVRLMIDGAGRWLARRPSLAAFRAAGGTARQFRPLLALYYRGPRNLRNHRKLVIADDARLWMGGRNLASEYFCGEPGKAPWIDLSFDLTGPIAAIAARQFEADWVSGTGQSSDRKIEVGRPDREWTGAPAQFLPSGPDQQEDTAESLLIAACYRAERRMVVTTPYLVPDEPLLKAMRLAARRGVQMTIVLPAVSNHHLADFVRGRAVRLLSDAGVDIRLIPTMVHAKAVVVDEIFAMCGSINIDSRSLLLNYEAAVVFHGKAEIEWLARWIQALANRGSSFKPQPPGIVRDLAEGMLLTLAFQL